MRRAIVVAAALVTLLVVAGQAVASEQHPTLDELEGRIMCPTCKGQTLAESNAPAADRVRDFIRRRIRAGDTRSEIESKLVDDFGQGILAAPPKRGFGLLAWVLPLVGLGLGALAVGLLAWRWSRGRDGASRPGTPELDGRVRLDPDLEKRLDEELARFDS